MATLTPTRPPQNKAAAAKSANKTAAKAKSAPSTHTFAWTGIDKRGNKVSGELISQSNTLAKASLIKQGIRNAQVRKKSPPRGKKITSGDIAVFARQMATMMKAGVPLVQAFDIVAEGLENPSMRVLVMQIRDSVAAGGGFANALREHPKHFDDLFCNLVDAGETSGALETMLDRIATYKEKTEALRAKIKKALTYPILVIAVALIVTVILLVWVVPQFAETFGNFGADLPVFTLFVLGLSEWMQAYWYWLLIIIAASVLGFKQLHARSPKFAYLVDRYMLKVPVVGKLLYLSVMARFARTLSTTFAAGVPLIDALTSVAGAAGNRIYEASILDVREDVASGLPLNTALKTSGNFPSLLVQMAAIGEESGSLDGMLDKVAGYYEEAVDNTVDTLTAMLEPLIMSVLGVLVGGLLIAMYLPIFQLGSVIS